MTADSPRRRSRTRTPALRTTYGWGIRQCVPLLVNGLEARSTTGVRTRKTGVSPVHGGVGTHHPTAHTIRRDIIDASPQEGRAPARPCSRARRPRRATPQPLRRPEGWPPYHATWYDAFVECSTTSATPHASVIVRQHNIRKMQHYACETATHEERTTFKSNAMKTHCRT